MTVIDSNSPIVLPIFLTHVYMPFSLGKYFEKEEDVRGVPQESVYLR